MNPEDILLIGYKTLVEQQQAEIEKLKHSVECGDIDRKIAEKTLHSHQEFIWKKEAEITRLRTVVEKAKEALDEIRNQAIICKEGEMCALSESEIIAITTKALSTITDLEKKEEK